MAWLFPASPLKYCWVKDGTDRKQACQGREDWDGMFPCQNSQCGEEVLSKPSHFQTVLGMQREPEQKCSVALCHNTHAQKDQTLALQTTMTKDLDKRCWAVSVL